MPVTGGPPRTMGAVTVDAEVGESMTVADGDPLRPRVPWWLVTSTARAAEALLVLWLIVTVGGIALLVTGATPWVSVPVLLAGVTNIALDTVSMVYLRRLRRR
jgi:hypothetical protein